MGKDFFPAVEGPIRYGGLDSTDPFTYKVYEPDRSCSASAWRTTCASGSASGTRSPGRAPTCSASAPSTGRGSRAVDPMAAARAKLAAAFEFFTKLGMPYYCFHDRDVAPEGATFAESAANLDALADEAAGHQERTGVTPPVGHRQPVQPPALRGRRRDQPGPRGLRLRRGAGEAHAGASPSDWAARTTSCGAAARATRRCSTRTSAARAGSSPASCTWWPSTSTRSASRARC